MFTQPSPLRIAIMGAGGRMGRMLIQAVSDTPNAVLVGAFVKDNSSLIGVDAGELCGIDELGVSLSALDLSKKADVLIDFSLPDALPNVLTACQDTHTALVLGVTGLSSDKEALVGTASQNIPIVYAGNYSTGVNLSLNLLAAAAKTLGLTADVELIETHHQHKLDAPSGTALMMAKAVAAARGQTDDCFCYGRQGSQKRACGEIGIHALRGGEVVGEHTVRFLMNGEVLEISHQATSRMTFAIGAVRAAMWLTLQKNGLYDMQDVLHLNNS